MTPPDARAPAGGPPWDSPSGVATGYREHTSYPGVADQRSAGHGEAVGYRDPGGYDQATGYRAPGGYGEAVGYRDPGGYDQATGYQAPGGHDRATGYQEVAGYPDPGGAGGGHATAEGRPGGGGGGGFLADWERNSAADGTDVWGAPMPGANAGISIQARSRREFANATGEGRVEGGVRLLVLLLFWFALAASVELWWLNTEPLDVHSAGSMLVAAGRITGMVAGFVLLVQVLMMSRVAWLEHWVGAHDLLLWHRELGGFLFVTVLAHTFLLIFGYAAASAQSVWKQTWSLLTMFEDMISAFLATGILVAVAVLAIRRIRRRMRYELWYLLHLSSYLVLLLSYGHQFALGEELMKSPFARWYWMVLYAFALSCLFWGRIVEPLWMNAKHRFRVLNVVPEGPGIVSIYIGGRRLERLDARAGQYFRWRFLGRGYWWQAHPFSLSAAPNAEWLRLTVKVVGDHTTDLQYLDKGTRVFAEGPSGVFTADHGVQADALLIAGGSGIAPIRALMEALPPGTVVLYRASKPEDIVFRHELDWMAAERGMRIHYVLGGRDEPWPRHVFTPRGMRELIPDVTRRDVYMCGPQGLIDTSLTTLRRLRVPQKQIHLDPFEF